MKRSVLAAVAAAWLVACGGGSSKDTTDGEPDDGTGGNEPVVPLTAATFCAESWRRSTTRHVECLRAGASEMKVFAEEGLVTCMWLAAGTEAGRARFDAEAAGHCVEEEASQPCEELRSNFPLASCDAVFTGALPAGAACSGIYECESGFCDASLTCPGTCAPFAPLGGACTWWSCGPGLACDDSHVCAAPSPPAAEGEPCGNVYPLCEAGLRCAQRDIQTGARGTCVPRGGFLEPCDFPSDCATGLYCPPRYSPMSGQCVPVVAEGLACAHEPTACVSGTECVGGVCAPYPSVGEPCDDVCLGGSCGTNGVCTAYALEDEPCDAAVACNWYLECVDGTCQRPCSP